MLCPACRTDNFEGEDNCGNCGADLRTRDIPQAVVEFADSLLGEHLGALGMTSPRTVDATMPVADAIALMHRDSVDCLLVCDDDRLVGIFTDRDAVMKVAGSGHSGLELREVMTPDPVVLGRDDTVAVAIHKMAVGGFRHIPVVDGQGRDEPVGVVSAADVFRHLTTATS